MHGPCGEPAARIIRSTVRQYATHYATARPAVILQVKSRYGHLISHPIPTLLPPCAIQTLLGQNVDEIDTLDEVVSDLTLKVSDPTHVAWKFVVVRCAV